MFKRDGARAVSVKASVGTRKMLRRGAGLAPGSFALSAGNPVPTKFRLRILARKFGKRFTGYLLSPMVSAPRPPRTQTPTVALPEGDCDGDGQKNGVDVRRRQRRPRRRRRVVLVARPVRRGHRRRRPARQVEFDCDRNGVLNRDQADDDSDLLSDMHLGCRLGPTRALLDTDGDSVEDGFEYQSARDLNDDEYQGDPNQILPYPGQAPVPEPAVRRRAGRRPRRQPDTRRGAVAVEVHVQREPLRGAHARDAELTQTATSTRSSAAWPAAGCRRSTPRATPGMAEFLSWANPRTRTSTCCCRR